MKAWVEAAVKWTSVLVDKTRDHSATVWDPSQELSTVGAPQKCSEECSKDMMCLIGEGTTFSKVLFN